ncbi:hypothetical protein CRG98_012591 [Punica granatum]|uniref:Uncharacterized protein n=1 Tax=Punica granatum TaxID=22663 RepID=A0A2I0KFT7_PUNGR|nr:hypothetical protein CRG98_012591 [Punica granatum]
MREMLSSKQRRRKMEEAIETETLLKGDEDEAMGKFVSLVASCRLPPATLIWLGWLCEGLLRLAIDPKPLTTHGSPGTAKNNSRLEDRPKSRRSRVMTQERIPHRQGDRRRPSRGTLAPETAGARVQTQ